MTSAPAGDQSDETTEAEGARRCQGDQPLSEVVLAQKELLWGEYTELRTHARHAETVRTSAVNFVLPVTSALVAVITRDGKIDGADFSLCCIVTGVGVSSTVYCVLFVARYEKHRAQAECVRAELDCLFFVGRGMAKSLATLRQEGEAHVSGATGDRLLRLKAATIRGAGKVALSSHAFWVVMPAIVSVIGIFLTVDSVFS
jgi:hypothetical protein